MLFVHCGDVSGVFVSSSTAGNAHSPGAFQSEALEQNDERDEAAEKRSKPDAWFCQAGALGTDHTRGLESR
jgi:hypothetical protein